LKQQEYSHEVKQKSYSIEKVDEYTSRKFNAVRTDWIIRGDVTMNNLDTALKDLIDKMTQNEPENVLIQLSIRFIHSDK
jgi:phenylalanyl-tRNA synthetase alpha subunit